MIPDWSSLPSALVGTGMQGMALAAMDLQEQIDAAVAGGEITLPYLGRLALMGLVPALLLLLVSCLFHVRMHSKTRRLARSLREANTRLLRANSQLQKIAFRDPLTGVANRVLLELRLERSILQANEPPCRTEAGLPGRVALLYIDLDGFKPVNDVEGHAAGDALLCQVAARLRRMVRQTDTLARVGGDEFVVLLSQPGSVADAVVMAGRVHKAMRRPFDLAGRRVSISGSIGVAVYPDHADKEHLMAAADAAMYTAKRAGGNSYAVFEESMRQGVAAQFDLQQALRRAVANGELSLHYQPKIDARTGRIRSVEALARWAHPVYGQISPNVFIPIAERFGLMNEIGDWVIDEACRQVAQWAVENRFMRVSINISGHQIFHARIHDYIQAAIARHRIEPRQLIFEITESVAMEDDKATMAVIATLTRLGVKISIDDFGTGYSSLALLRQLSADEVKIDRSFVRDVAVKGDARAVVDAIVRLAHALDLRVVAEGVTNQQQRDVLEALGCDEFQGFYFARPMDAGTLIASEIWTADGFEPVRFSGSSFINNL